MLHPTSFNDFVEALSEVHHWVFYIYKEDEIEIVKSAQYNGQHGYMIRRKGSNGEPIFVYKDNIIWWCAGCSEYVGDQEPSTDICDPDCCEMDYDGNLKR